MNDHFNVVETRMQADGSVRHLVQAHGGTIVVYEDPAGNLTGRVRSGYVATYETEEDPIGRSWKPYASFVEIPMRKSITARPERLNKIYRMQFV